MNAKEIWSAVVWASVIVIVVVLIGVFVCTPLKDRTVHKTERVDTIKVSRSDTTIYIYHGNDCN